MTSWATDKVIEAIAKWFAQIIIGGLNLLWDLLSASVFVSPDVTVLPQVRTFSATSLGIVNTAYVLAILWMAILVMGRDTIQSRYGPGELIPRLVIGLIAANMSMPLCSTLIQLANALTEALTKQDITAPGSMQHMRSIVSASLTGTDGNSSGGFLMLVIGLIIAILVGILLMQWIVRLGVLIVAVGIAPIALALHGTPQTEGAAKLWWRTVLGTLGTVVMQAVALHTALSIFLDPSSNLFPSGTQPGSSAVMSLFVVLCLLWGVIKIPGLMRRYITRTPPSQAGTIIRVMLIQQLTSGLRRGMAAGRNAVRPSGARAPHSGGGAGWPVQTTQPARPRGGWNASTPRHSTSMPRHPSGSMAPASPAPRPAPAPKTPAGNSSGASRVAWPTGRPVKPYTPDELRQDVDSYTSVVKKRHPGAANGRTT